MNSMHQALAGYMERAAEKLRAEGMDIYPPSLWLCAISFRSIDNDGCPILYLSFIKARMASKPWVALFIMSER